ncbi:MAG: antibiotic biosynthesis monooxygenase family protein, partial [Thermoanaerobaculia bacterium]
REKADEYAQFTAGRAIPDYTSTPGNLAAWVLRRDDGEVTHFLTISRWESEDAIRAFAGERIARAKYYPEDNDYLLEFEEELQHYRVVASS